MIHGLLNKIRALIRYVKYDGKITNLTLSQISYGQILSGKKIVVTGGTSGIGLAMAKKFLSEGAEVLITGRNIQKLESVKQELNTSNLYTLQWDVSDMGVMQSKFEEAVSKLGGINVLVNNAAFLERKQTDERFYDATLNTNLKSVYFLCQISVKSMISLNGDQGGKIINISSINGFMSSTHPYYISKWGLNGLTKGFAKEYASKNIIVNAIAPGYCASSINYRDVTENAYDSKSQIKRLIIPEDIAEIATFLASEASNGIVGQVIVCDGGTTL